MDFHLRLYCRHILLWAIVNMCRLTVKTLKNVGRCAKQGKDSTMMPPSSTRKIMSFTVLMQAQSTLEPHHQLSQNCLIALGEHNPSTLRHPCVSPSSTSELLQNLGVYHLSTFRYPCVYQHEVKPEQQKKQRIPKPYKKRWLWRLMQSKTYRRIFCYHRRSL